MNIFGSRSKLLVAKTCGWGEKGKQKVTYNFDEEFHNQFVDKKDIILAELQACEKLLVYSTSESERVVVQREITNLKNTLDLLT